MNRAGTGRVHRLHPRNLGPGRAVVSDTKDNLMLEFLDKPGFLIVALAGILIFGAKRLPDSARALGRSMRILKAETKGLHDDGTAARNEAAALPRAE